MGGNAHSRRRRSALFVVGGEGAGRVVGQGDGVGGLGMAARLAFDSPSSFRDASFLTRGGRIPTFAERRPGSTRTAHVTRLRTYTTRERQEVAIHRHPRESSFLFVRSGKK